MKKIISLLVLVLFSTSSYSDIPWKDYMSTPNDQGANGPCATYAAVHCLEALYNYYYELGSNKVELDVDYAVEHFGSYGGSYEGNVLDVFENIKNNWEVYGEDSILTIGIPSVSGINSFPNYDHAYYSLKDKGTCATQNAIETRVKNYGPVCINIRWDTNLADSTLDVFEEYSGGDPINYTQYGNSNHWVVVVGVGADPCPYFECLSSFPTGDGYYFKIQTYNYDSWKFNLYENGYAYLHDESYGTTMSSQALIPTNSMLIMLQRFTHISYKNFVILLTILDII